MAVNFSNGFNITSKEAVDTRIFKTKSQMKNMTEVELARMPDNYFAMCPDDGQIYFYAKDNPVSETTGKFKAFDSTMASDIQNSTEVKTALTENIGGNISSNTTVQTAIGTAITNNTGIQSSIGSVIETNTGVQGSIGSVIENSESVQESIGKAIESSEEIQDKIGDSVQSALDSGKVEIKVATELKTGVVISSEDKNSVSVDDTSGKMEVNTIGVEKLSDTAGFTLYICGGKAPIPLTNEEV